MRISQVISVSEKGPRHHNDDALLCRNDVPIFVLADGMGEDNSGYTAANQAVKTIEKQASKLTKLRANISMHRSTKNRLALAHAFDNWFNVASREIANDAANSPQTNIASTLLVATVVACFAYIGHVGDSRAYLIRGGGLVRLTEDHTVAEFRFRRGRMTRAEYESSQDRHVLYQALGTGVEVDVDIAEVRITEGDGLLLCTDGLIRALDEEKIAGMLDTRDLKTSATRMLKRIRCGECPDNASFVLIGFEGEDGDESMDSVTDAMEGAPLLAGLSKPECLLIAPYFEEFLFQPGDEIGRTGEPLDGFFLVVSGKIRLITEREKLVDIKPGGFFGELALAAPAAIFKSVRVMARTRVLFFSRDRFHELIRNKPDLGGRLSITLLGRLGSKFQSLSSQLAVLHRDLWIDAKE